MPTVVKSYTTSGTYTDTIPSNCSTILIECWGGGGAGAGSLVAVSARAGAAGGQYAKRTISNPTSGQAISITVAGTKTGTTGNAGSGNDSYVSINSVEQCRAKGGAGATTNTGGLGSTTNGIGDTVYAGGSGAIGSDLAYSGGGGSGANSDRTGQNAVTYIGGNSTRDGGDGGNGGLYVESVDNNGVTGIVPGGGGGGAMCGLTSAIGGNGASGTVKITYTIVNIANHFFGLP